MCVIVVDMDPQYQGRSCIVGGVPAREKYGKSPLGKYRIRKESVFIRKDVIIPVVLGEVRDLSIHCIKMTCIYF